MADNNNNPHDVTNRLSEDDLMALFAEDEPEDEPSPVIDAKPIEQAPPQEAVEPVVSMDDEINELTSFLDNFAEELKGASGAEDETGAVEVPAGEEQEFVGEPALESDFAYEDEDGLDSLDIDDLAFDAPEAETPEAETAETETELGLAVPELAEEVGADEMDADIPSMFELPDEVVDDSESAALAPDAMFADTQAEEPDDVDLRVDSGLEQAELFEADAAENADDESVGQDEVADGEAAAKVPNEGGLDEVVPTVATATAAKSVVGGADVTSSLRQAQQEEKRGEEPMNRMLVMGAAALGLLGILIGGASYMMASEVQGQIASLGQQLDAMNLRVAKLGGGAGAGSDPRITALADDVKKVGKRIDEMAIIIEGPLSHASAATEEGRDELEQRLEALEASLKGLDSKLQAQKQTVAVKPQTVATGSTSKPAAKPVAAKPGDWIVAVVSLSNQASAEFEQSRMRKQGIPAELRVADSGGKTWYRIVVTGFSSREEADAYSKELESKYGINDAWATRN